MKNIDKILKKLKYSENVKRLVLDVLEEVKASHDKPVSSNIQINIHKRLSEIVKDEN